MSETKPTVTDWQDVPDCGGLWLFRPKGSDVIYSLELIEVPARPHMKGSFSYHFDKSGMAHIDMTQGTWRKAE